MMRRRSLILAGAPVALAALSLAVAGCGDDSDSGASPPATTAAATTTAAPAATTTAPAATTTAPGSAAKVAVVMGTPKEFSLTAVPPRVAAGEVTFLVSNKGAVEHEMVVVPSSGGAAALRQADGTASEDGSEGEVPDVQPGGGGQLTVTLPAGTYVLLCNLPGHFAGGMYANFVVK